MELKDLPKLTFADADVDSLLDNALKIVRELLKREISRADPLMLFIKSFLAIIVQQRLLIDTLAKQNLLAYAKNDALDHLGVLVGVDRLPASAATCTVEVTLSAPRQRATSIMKGTRVNAGDNVNFALDDAIVFPSGETSATVKATCLEVGEVGNGYAVGELKNIVDPQPFLASIINITESEGGADVEDDDSFRLRIHEAPEKFSNAGSKGAYEFWAKTASNLISDVYVISEDPGEVSVYVLLDDGEIPNDEMLETVANTLNDKKVRPLTDLVHVKPPIIQKYNIEARYYISRSDAISAVAIQQRCENAVDDYIAWQKKKLGRDINPTELMYLIRSAGAKRAAILEPEFTKIPANVVALAENISVTYGGIEDD